MRRKILFNLILLITVFFLSSCSSMFHLDASNDMISKGVNGSKKDTTINPTEIVLSDENEEKLGILIKWIFNNYIIYNEMYPRSFEIRKDFDILPSDQDKMNFLNTIIRFENDELFELDLSLPISITSDYADSLIYSAIGEKFSNHKAIEDVASFNEGKYNLNEVSESIWYPSILIKSVTSITESRVKIKGALKSVNSIFLDEFSCNFEAIASENQESPFGGYTLQKLSIYNSVMEGSSSNRYLSNFNADAFINALDKDVQLTSRLKQFHYLGQHYYLDMSDDEIEEIHQMSLKVTKDYDTDYEKVRAIYQWVTENIYYDEAQEFYGENNAYKVFNYRYGVCEGYARLTVEMLRTIDIPAVYISGLTFNTETNVADGGHAWVAIYADNRWFYANPTWDTTNRYVEETFIEGKNDWKHFDLTIQDITESLLIENLEAVINVDEFLVTYYNEHISIETYSGDESVVILPSTVNDLKITQVFTDPVELNLKAKGIIVPDGYEKLYSHSLSSYLNAEYVLLPDSIRGIGVKAIGDNVEIYCENSEKVHEYASFNKLDLVKEIPDNLNNKSTSFTGNLTEDRDVTHIKDIDFIIKDDILIQYLATDKEVTIPDHVRIIGADAFRNSKLEKVSIPDSVSRIEDGAFQYCNMLKEIIIPDSVTELGQYVFRGCSNLKRVVLPAGLNVVSVYLFEDCSSLKEIVIPDNVHNIDHYAFRNCTSLETINLPDNIIYIGNESFANCTSLKTFLNMEKEVRFGDKALDNTKWFHDYEGDFVMFHNTLIKYRGNESIITIPDHVTIIADGAFYSMPFITQVKVTSGVKVIDHSAFRDCINLTEIILPDTVNSIGFWAFYGCSNLEKIKIPNKTYLGQDFLAETKWMKDYKEDFIILNGHLIGYQGTASKVVIPDKVTAICTDAFYENSKITEVTVPKSVNKIYDYGFENCGNLRKVTILGDDVSLDYCPFLNCSSDLKLYAKPGGAVQDYANEHNLQFEGYVVDAIK